METLQSFAMPVASQQHLWGWLSAPAHHCHNPKALESRRVSVQGTYLVLSESMVWKSFSSSSSFSVPSEKKAWNSSRDSFPSSANSNTVVIRKWAKQGHRHCNSRVMFEFKDSDQNYLKALLHNWLSTNAKLTSHRVRPGSPEARWSFLTPGCGCTGH